LTKLQTELITAKNNAKTQMGDDTAWAAIITDDITDKALVEEIVKLFKDVKKAHEATKFDSTLNDNLLGYRDGSGTKKQA